MVWIWPKVLVEMPVVPTAWDALLMMLARLSLLIGIRCGGGGCRWSGEMAKCGTVTGRTQGGGLRASHDLA